MDKEEADRLIEKAKLCLRSGRKDKALQLLNEAQSIYPSTRTRGKFSNGTLPIYRYPANLHNMDRYNGNRNAFPLWKNE